MFTNSGCEAVMLDANLCIFPAHTARRGWIDAVENKNSPPGGGPASGRGEKEEKTQEEKILS